MMRPIFWKGYLIMMLLFASDKTPAQTHLVSTGKDSCTIHIYLSFDDGPIAASWHLVDIADKDSIPLNVFVTGRQVYHSDTGIAILQLYRNSKFMELFNHSYSHADKKYKIYYNSPGKVVSDIKFNEQFLALKNKIVRLPGRNNWRIGNRKKNDLKDAVKSADSLSVLGFSIIGWDVEWSYDSTFKSFNSASQMIALVKTVADKAFTPKHVVILCHDFMLLNKYSREQLLLFIQLIKSDDCLRITFLSSYPGVMIP